MSSQKKMSNNFNTDSIGKSVDLLSGNSRALLDLCVAFGIAIAMLFLNVVINFSSKITAVFDGENDLVVTRMIINVLFLWLATLMVVAFIRWRASCKKAVELSQIISSISPDTLMVVGGDHIIGLCTASVKRMFGYDVVDVVGKNTDFLYSYIDTPEKSIDDTIDQQGFYVGRAEGVCEGSEKIILEVISCELAGGQGRVVLLRDISRRDQAEEAQHRIEEKLQRRHKLASLGALAGGVAHDFNNFLMVIRGNIDLMAMRGDQDSELSSSLEDIGSACDKATELCQQMLAYSGKGAVVLKLANITDIVKETDRLLDVSVLDKVERIYDLDESLPLLTVDVSQVRQIVLNLLTNAADAISGPAGSITMRTSVVALADVEIDKFYFDEMPTCSSFVLLEVSDNGCGMDEETMTSVFEPFFSTKPSGRGLGLASVPSIMRNHKGGLLVQSTIDTGTVFKFLFPIPELAEL